MKYTEQKDFIYNPDLFKKSDTQIALRIQKEYIVRHSGVPFAKFMEVDRSPGAVDPLWHSPIDGRTKIVRTLELPALQTADKPAWQLTKLGIQPMQKVRFTIANLTLKEFDYFPLRGDFVYRNGYRYTIRDVVVDPGAWWHQTGVWLSIVAECVIAPFGDALPDVNPGVTVPAETSPNAPK